MKNRYLYFNPYPMSHCLVWRTDDAFGLCDLRIGTAKTTRYTKAAALVYRVRGICELCEKKFKRLKF